MKRYISLLILLACLWRVQAQDQNYVRTYVATEDTTDVNAVITGDKYHRQETTQYFDGLGRPIQVVNRESSPSGNDVVQHIAYDEYGREKVKYLPYVSPGSDGQYKTGFVPKDDPDYTTSAQYQFYQEAVNVAHDTNPYAETIFEPSPLNRPFKQGAPGAAWQPDEDINTDDHSVKFGYTSNTINEVYQWEVTEAGECKLSGTQYYESNQLYVSITKDENWISTQAKANDGTVREYKDKQGRVVLKRTYNNNESHDTYYVYDDFGNLRYVLPPEAIRQLTDGGLTGVNDSNVLAGDATFPGSYSTSQAYYYMPSSTITIGPGSYTAGFAILPYPLSSAFIANYLFVYQYDHRHRLIEKKVPGAEPVYMIYDQRDRLVLTQDGNQRETGEWLFTKYDALNRPVITGIYTNNISRESMQDLVNSTAGSSATWYESFTTATGNVQGYDNTSFPTTGITKYLTVSYYDNYDFLSLSEFDTHYDFGSANGIYTETQQAPVRGQVTGSKVLNLGDDSWLQTVTYYDHKYRPIRIKANNNVSGYEQVYNQYDFTGNVLNTQTVHSKTGETDITIDERYNYDHAKRLLYAEQSMDGGTTWVRLFGNEYNELGELVTKHLHSEDNGSTFAQDVDYKYNIRGWLTDINDPNNVSTAGDYFGMKLRYNDPAATTQLGSKEQYNGNISELQFKNAQATTLSSYGFSYDGLNRLGQATYGETTTYLVNKDAFNEALSYDFNGNIQTLQRTGEGNTIDDLTYAYQGNQLQYVQDDAAYTGDLSHFKDGNSGTDYSYDANGNMTGDKNKGITSIQYNHLNLPEQITFADGNTITYHYDAAGIKLKKIVNENSTLTTTDYVGGFVYENDELQFMQTAEGRVMLNHETVNGPEYQYHLEDHLGNTRVTFTTAPGTDRTSQYLATMEPAAQALEESTFSIPDLEDSDPLNNHTPGGTTSIRTNGAEGRVTGPSMSLHVLAGDQLDMRAYFKYYDVATTGSTVAGAATLVAGNVASGGGGELAELASVITENAGLINNLVFSSDNSRPKAYLHYLFFDKDYNYQSGGMAQVGTSTGVFQELSLQFTASEEGYVLVYTANQTAEDLDVYVDDFYVEHVEGPIVRTDDYYPFGLAFNSTQRTGVLTNKYLYNGKELQTDLNLDWYDYGARMYDASIGRWHVIDLLSSISPGISPMSYCYNNPINYIDPTGMIGEQDIWGRDRFDSFTGMYIPPMDRPGGMFPNIDNTLQDGGYMNSHYGGGKREITSDDIAGSYELVEYGTDVYRGGKLVEHTPEGYYLAPLEDESSQNEGKINLRTTTAPFDDVVNLMMTLPHQEPAYVDDYFARAIPENGTWHFGYQRADIPLIVKGKKVSLQIQFDKNNQLSKLVGRKVFKGLNGAIEYRIYAYGKRDENLGGAFDPKLIQLIFADEELFKSTWDYMTGKRSHY